MLKRYPIHDFWDAFTLVYTLCVSKIAVVRESELYLLQLTLIIKVWGNRLHQSLWNSYDY